MPQKEYDAILIPGGGILPSGQLPIWVVERLDYALSVHNGEHIITLSAGTIHKPPVLDENGFPVFESVAAAHYLQQQGIDPLWILTEKCSYDTIGNAFFSKIVHVDPRAFKKLLIITSAFHMPRTQKIFKWIYNLNKANNSYDLSFYAVEDHTMDPEWLEARKLKENKGLQLLDPLIASIQTMEDLHRWLFTQHSAYKAIQQFSVSQGKEYLTY